jgi:integrase
MTPHYKYKVTRPIRPEEFFKTIKEYPKILSTKHLSFLALIYWSGVRITEALNLEPNDFVHYPNHIEVRITRLKGSKQTENLVFPLKLAYVNDIVWQVKNTNDECKIWDFNRKTGYNIVKRVFPNLYPHFFRLNRITDIIRKHGLSGAKTYTGLTLNSLNFYVGTMDIKKIGESLE